MQILPFLESSEVLNVLNKRILPKQKATKEKLTKLIAQHISIVAPVFIVMEMYIHIVEIRNSIPVRRVEYDCQIVVNNLAPMGRHSQLLLLFQYHHRKHFIIYVVDFHKNVFSVSIVSSNEKERNNINVNVFFRFQDTLLYRHLRKRKHSFHLTINSNVNSSFDIYRQRRYDELAVPFIKVSQMWHE